LSQIVPDFKNLSLKDLVWLLVFDIKQEENVGIYIPLVCSRGISAVYQQLLNQKRQMYLLLGLLVEIKQLFSCYFLKCEEIKEKVSTHTLKRQLHIRRYEAR